MSLLNQGDRISNYILERRLGAGSFAQVWRAHHHVLGDVVAIKIPTEPQYVRNLQREGVVVHGLKHANIVRVIDLDPYSDPPYLVMECIDGPSLRDAIDHYGSSFPIGAVETVMRGVLGALATAHAGGLIHRDIKPANILLAHPLDQMASITQEAVRVTDFGLGRVGRATTESIMQSGSVADEAGKRIAGTLAYMAPEHKEGGDVDASSDLYSCGIMLFEMLTGGRPHGGEVPSALRADVPDCLDEVFKRCYARRDRRFSSALEMLDAMSPAKPGRASPPPLPVGVVHADATGLKCPACRSSVLRTDNFCIRCGHQLAASVPKCRHCGEFVQHGDRFCIQCGKNLTVLS